MNLNLYFKSSQLKARLVLSQSGITLATKFKAYY